jgi:hypothetical protein
MYIFSNILKMDVAMKLEHTLTCLCLVTGIMGKSLSTSGCTICSLYKASCYIFLDLHTGSINIFHDQLSWFTGSGHQKFLAGDQKKIKLKKMQKIVSLETILRRHK